MLVNIPDHADLRILLIEDDETDADLVQRMLDGLPERVHLLAVWNGHDAIRTLSDAAIAPDLVILDLNLPGLQGGEVLDWMRARPALHRVAVIVLTEIQDRTVLENMCARGANAALSKDLTDRDRAELRQIITDFWFHGRVDALQRELESPRI